VTYNPDFKVTIIQRQITQKQYKIDPYLQWRTNRKSYMIYLTAPFPVTLKNPCPSFQGHAILWRWIWQKTDIMGLIHALLNSVISDDLEWLSKTFNDTKRRAVSLRQLSFLFCFFRVVDSAGYTSAVYCTLNTQYRIVTHILRSRQYLTLNMALTVQDRHMFMPTIDN